MPDKFRSLTQVSQGRTTRQAHQDVNDLKDEELGRQGFDGPVTLFYRNGDPTRYRTEGRFHSTYLNAYSLDVPDREGADRFAQRLFFNSDCSIWLSRRSESMPWFRRNVDGDECWFVHEGHGIVATEYGEIPFGAGDYVYLPKGTTHRWQVDGGGVVLFGLETREQLRVPVYPGLGRHAPFDADVIRVPALKPAVTEQGEYEIKVKYDGEYSALFTENHPFDVHGWKGDLFPFAFNIEDWNVIMSASIHLPPSMHVFMKAPGINLINLLPRPMESNRSAERVPWYHRNADYDEVSFLHGGNVFGQEMPPGLIVHDPQGIQHGLPEEVRVAARSQWKEHDRMDLKGIMVETRTPLRVDPGVAAITSV
jgi:homogentisate 1,2-dioxygenase